MTRFMKAACVVSVLALGYAANADQQQVEIQARVPGYCNIMGDPGHQISNGTAFTDGDHTTFDYSNTGHGNFFVKTDGTGRAQSGGVIYTVFSNDQCNYTLHSANGAMRNAATGDVRDYYAYAHPQSVTGTPVHLAIYSPNAAVNTFSIPATIAGGTNTVLVDFSIPASGILAAGDYQDVLYLSITPAH